MSTVLQPPKQPQTIGSKIDTYYDLREQKRDINTQIKELDEQLAGLEESILTELGKMDLRLGRGSRASATVTESIVPTVSDWDTVQAYIKENDALHLMERRISSAAWRELYESGEPVPGTEPFKKVSISIRKV